MDERDQVHGVARESGAVTDWEHYRWCRNEVKRRLCDAERIYVQKEMNGNQSSNAVWTVIRNCIPSKEKSRPVYSRDMTELANQFNEFFTSVGARAAAESKRLASVNVLPAYKPPQPRPYSKQRNSDSAHSPPLKYIRSSCLFLQTGHQERISYRV